MKQSFQQFATLTLAALTALTLGVFASNAPVHAASHSDAPLIKLDPQANLTDVYAFVGQRPTANNGTEQVLNVVVQVHPFCEPGDGVIYDKFSNDALYSIHLANPTNGATIARYDFKFSGPSEGLKNPNTILSYGLGTAVGPIASIDDAHQNYTQKYSVAKVVGTTSTTLGTSLITAPPNVGLRVTPAYNDPSTGFAVSGATTNAGLDSYTKQAVHQLGSGVTVFCGMREDSFYCDIPGIFNLLDPRIIQNNNGGGLGQDGNGVDGFKGYNVLVYAIQIPLTAVQAQTYTAPFFGTKQGIGVYASVSRPRITLRSSNSSPVSSGAWVQVNRMGNPFFNEALVALKDKDNYNRDSPTSDNTKYATYAQNPELAVLLNAVFGTSFQATGRTDLKAVFIPDVLRVDLNTGPVKLAGQNGFSRLGFIGGDTTGGTSTNTSGWPNGRRFGDDVMDVALTAIASGPTYSNITLVGDNIDHNDQVYNQVFPYAATPNSGARNRKDSF